jgi:hypothetical protein
MTTGFLDPCKTIMSLINHQKTILCNLKDTIEHCVDPKEEGTDSNRSNKTFFNLPSSINLKAQSMYVLRKIDLCIEERIALRKRIKDMIGSAGKSQETVEFHHRF